MNWKVTEDPNKIILLDANSYLNLSRKFKVNQSENVNWTKNICLYTTLHLSDDLYNQKNQAQTQRKNSEDK